MTAPRSLTIGVDVVDLTEARREREDAARFDSRVFGAGERETIRGERDRWKLWTAKEAAYKAALKQFGNLDFAHPRFAVSTTAEAENLGVVTHERFTANVRWSSGEDWVLAVAVLGPGSADAVGKARWRVHRSGALTHAGESGAARRLAEELLAEGGSARKECDLSLSHHGHYVSAALLDEGGGS